MRERGGRRGVVRLGNWGRVRPSPPSSLYRRGGQPLAPPPSPRGSQRGQLAPQGAKGPWGMVRPAHVGCCTTPSVHVGPEVGGSHLGTFRNLLELFGTLPKNSRTFPEPENHFPYMKLYIRTLPELLVISRISSETPNQHLITPLIYLSHKNPSYIEALSM